MNGDPLCYVPQEELGTGTPPAHRIRHYFMHTVAGVSQDGVGRGSLSHSPYRPQVQQGTDSNSGIDDSTPEPSDSQSTAFGRGKRAAFLPAHLPHKPSTAKKQHWVIYLTQKGTVLILCQLSQLKITLSHSIF